MKNIIIAGSLTHAKAMLQWQCLSEENWDVAAYGSALHATYGRAIIVRPLEGVTKEHWDWLLEVLVPAVARGGEIDRLPTTWFPHCSEPFHDDEPEQVQVAEASN